MGSQGVATREIFPTTFRSAVRQRTRWVTGIALQTWDRHGWGGGLAISYWLWRDRKGLIGNPLSLLTNAVFAYGAFTWTAAWAGQWRWGMQDVAAETALLLTVTTVLGVYRIVYRSACVWRHFGPLFAMVVTLRVVIANCINSVATLRALYTFVVSRLNHEPLRWVKTEHQYPNPAALAVERLPLGEILVRAEYVTADELRNALKSQPAGRRLGAHLMALGLIDEEMLYEALSLQSGMPYGWIDPLSVRRSTARSLPARVTRERLVVPFKVEDGRLYLAGPEPPSADAVRAVRQMSSLTPKFWLITPSNYDLLVESLL
jgi:adsorption protein B